MIRNLLSGALVALLALSSIPFSAQTTDPGTTDPNCVSGQASGAWDLPGARGIGRVRGLLVDAGGRKFVLEAKLIPVLLPGGLRGGRMDGVLVPLTTSGLAPLPIAEAHGTYVVGLEGRGRFEATITELARDPLSRPERIGGMAGLFRDPERVGSDPVGRFVGRWALCR